MCLTLVLGVTGTASRDGLRCAQGSCGISHCARCAKRQGELKRLRLLTISNRTKESLSCSGIGKTCKAYVRPIMTFPNSVMRSEGLLLARMLLAIPLIQAIIGTCNVASPAHYLYYHYPAFSC
jgi:hypothetical protein